MVTDFHRVKRDVCSMVNHLVFKTNSALSWKITFTESTATNPY